MTLSKDIVKGLGHRSPNTEISGLSTKITALHYLDFLFPETLVQTLNNGLLHLSNRFFGVTLGNKT